MGIKIGPTDCGAFRPELTLLFVVKDRGQFERKNTVEPLAPVPTEPDQEMALEQDRVFAGCPFLGKLPDHPGVDLPEPRDEAALDGGCGDGAGLVAHFNLPMK